MLTEMIFSGFGGQGILFAGKVLAYSAMKKGMECSWLPSYGPEMRGGTANCGVCLSDKEIGSPYVTSPDILASLNLPSLKRFESKVKEGGIIFVDGSAAGDMSFTRKDVRYIDTSASKIADNIDCTGMGNIIILGNILRECEKNLGEIDYETVCNVIKELFKGKDKVIEKNLRALEEGYGK